MAKKNASCLRRWKNESTKRREGAREEKKWKNTAEEMLIEVLQKYQIDKSQWALYKEKEERQQQRMECRGWNGKNIAEKSAKPKNTEACWNDKGKSRAQHQNEQHLEKQKGTWRNWSKAEKEEGKSCTSWPSQRRGDEARRLLTMRSKSINFNNNKGNFRKMEDELTSKL